MRAEWQTLYVESAQRFMLLLDELETYGKAEDIRVVFFFDN